MWSSISRSAENVYSSESYLLLAIFRIGAADFFNIMGAIDSVSIDSTIALDAIAIPGGGPPREQGRRGAPGGAIGGGGRRILSASSAFFFI